MVNVNRLKAAMLLAGYNNVESAANAIGMSPMTMYRRIKKGIFGSDEIALMMKTYHISKEDAMDIFFDGV